MEGDSYNNNNNEIYKECLRNHAASLGSYATDGCGEFTPDHFSGSGSYNCAACSCHRNFHRKVTLEGVQEPNAVEVITNYGGAGRQVMVYSPESSEKGSKKRFRTKFTVEQKEKMLEFAEKLGWSLQRRDEEEEIERFCRGIGISRKVFKVWMHNHKNCTASRSASNGNAASDLTT